MIHTGWWWGIAVCRGDYRMVIGMNGRMFYCYAYGENIEHFE